MNKQQRNQAIECCRLAAAIAVVFIHVRFPGQLGALINCLSRFSVPFFLVVSGYFSYGLQKEGLKKRIWAILKLNIVATALYCFWRGYVAYALQGTAFLPWLQETLSVTALAKWFVLSLNPFGGHLWYLSAMLVCYLVLYVYVCWMKNQYRPLYLFGCVMLAVHIILESYTRALYLYVELFLYRNALLMGLSLVPLGIFIREHQDRLREIFGLTSKKLVWLILLGMALSILEWLGTDIAELYAGTILEVFALMLLLANVPILVSNDSLAGRMIARFGGISTFVYITHLLWSEGYTHFFQDKMALRLGSWEPYLEPLLIAAFSLGTGALWEMTRALLKKRGSPRQSDQNGYKNRRISG